MPDFHFCFCLIRYISCLFVAAVENFHISNILRVMCESRWGSNKKDKLYLSSIGSALASHYYIHHSVNNLCLELTS